jgi:hypothetical protein
VFQAPGLPIGEDAGIFDFSQAAIDTAAPDQPVFDLASPPCPVAPSLAACWRFEGDVFDGTANANNATSSLVTYAPGVSGMSLQLAVQSSVHAADSPSLDAVDALTMEIWVRPSELPTAGLRAGLLDDDGQYGLFAYSAGEVRCSVAFTGLTGPANMLPIGAWTHVACSYDGATIRLYKNGVEVANLAATGKLGTGSASGLAIGGNSPNGDPFIGGLDELRIWTTARSAREICADSGVTGC